MTVGEYIKQHDNEVFEIDGKATTDDCDPLAWHIWKGMLHEVPDHLKSLKIIRDGWLLGKKCAVLEVLDP